MSLINHDILYNIFRKYISFVVAVDVAININFPTGSKVDFDFPHDGSRFCCV